MRHNLEFWHPDGDNWIPILNMTLTGTLAYVGFLMAAICAAEYGVGSGGFAAGAVMMIMAALSTAMFALHRSVGVSYTHYELMNSYYSLPRRMRKKYGISQRDLRTMHPADANRLAATINTYHSHRARDTSSGLGLLKADLDSLNEVTKELGH